MNGIKPILFGIFILLGTAISAQSLHPYPLDTIDGQVYYKYTVPRGVGIYRIAVTFGISQEEILKANPALMTRGLSYDEVVLIPTNLRVETHIASSDMTQVIVEAEPTQADEKVDTKFSDKQTIRKTTKRNKKWNSRFQKEEDLLMGDSILPSNLNDSSDVIKLAIMLPFQTDALKRDKNMDRFFDFYAGALLAINEVQKEGQHIELFTYDTGKSATTIDMLMQDSTWQPMDAIIGPAYPKQVAVATQYALRDSCWIVIPFSSKVDEVKDNPYVLKFNPSAETSTETFIHHLLTLGDSVNCVLFEAKDTTSVPASVKQIHQAINALEIPSITTTIRNILIDSIDSVFVHDKENIVIFNTESYNNVQTLLPFLTHAAERYHITLYSQFSWADKKMDLPQIYTSAFYDSIAVPEHYELAFLEYFGHQLSATHPRYDLLGYDLTLHLLRTLQKNHADTEVSPIETVWEGIQTNIHYQKTSPQGGYENQTIHIIRK